MEEIARSLSERQRLALQLDTDAILTAGAGAGKTRTLVAMVCRDLLVDDVPPQSIILCTFTRAAAANLIAQVSQTLDDLHPGHTLQLDRLRIGTIDALCSRMLTEHAIDAQLSPGFEIADDRMLMYMRKSAFERAIDDLDMQDLHALDDIVDTSSADFEQQVSSLHERLTTKSLVAISAEILAPPARRPPDTFTLALRLQELLDESALSAKGKEKLTEDLSGIRASDPAKFSNAKYGAIKDEKVLSLIDDIALMRQQLVDQAAGPPKRALARLVEGYDHHLSTTKSESCCLAFVDLVPALNSLLDHRPDLSDFERVYVDEAQDTNPLQLQVLERLKAPDGRLLSVGDASQSIYGFRNADIEGFRRQKARASQHLTLDENYRSHPQIVRTVNTVCSNIDGLKDDVVIMQAMREGDDHARVHLISLLQPGKAPDAHSEAQAAVPQILALAKEREMPLSDIAILCRTNADCEAYAHALAQAAVPVVLTQKRGLMARSEVQDAIAYLALLVDTADEQALLRVLSSPFAAVSDHDLYELAMERQGQPLWTTVTKRLSAFAAIVEQLRSKCLDIRPSSLLLLACEEHGFDMALEALDATGAMWRNIEKLAANVRQIERDLDGTALSAIVHRLQVESQLGLGGGQDARGADADSVQVMTIHNAKGAEFGMTVIGRMNKRPSMGSPTQMVWLDHDGTLGIKLASETYDSVAISARRSTEQAEIAECKRLMYVALTRAADDLVMVVSGRIKKDGTATLAGPAQWLFEQGLPALAFSEAQILDEDDTCTLEQLTNDQDEPLVMNRLHLTAEQEVG